MTMLGNLPVTSMAERAKTRGCMHCQQCVQSDRSSGESQANSATSCGGGQPHLRATKTGGTKIVHANRGLVSSLPAFTTAAISGGLILSTGMTCGNGCCRRDTQRIYLLSKCSKKYKNKVHIKDRTAIKRKNVKTKGGASTTALYTLIMLSIKSVHQRFEGTTCLKHAG